jgi:O-antigen/teichoic acid export membrane protein
VNLVREHTGLGLGINLLGKAWTALISIAFLPFFASALGPEAYGLLSFHAMALGLAIVLDMGLSTGITQRLAVVDKRDLNSLSKARDLLRSFETIYWLMAVLIGMALILAAPMLTRHWLNPVELSAETTWVGLRWIGLFLIFQWPQTLYHAALLGLYRPDRSNQVRVMQVTLQFFGSYLLIRYVEPSIVLYLIWQFVTAFLGVVAVRFFAWKELQTDKPAKFVWSLIRQNISYFKGLIVLTILSVFLSQADRWFISKMLPLASLGYYSLAFSLANSLQYIGQPFYASVLPKLSRLVKEQDHKGAADFYLRVSTFLAALTMPLMMFVLFFSTEIMTVWTRDVLFQEHSSSLLSVIVVGAAMNVIALMPLAMQLSHEWTQLTTRIYAALVVIYLPILYVLVQHWGALGAAYSWLFPSLMYVTIYAALMHRRINKGQLLQWYRQVLIYPSALALVGVFLSHQLLTDLELSKGPLAVALVLIAGLNIAAVVVLMRPSREILWDNLKKIPSLWQIVRSR